MPSFFFFNDTATTEIYTLSLHDALPISDRDLDDHAVHAARLDDFDLLRNTTRERSEEHTSELQSQSNLVCRLLLEKKKTRTPDCDASVTAQCHREHAPRLMAQAGLAAQC